MVAAQQAVSEAKFDGAINRLDVGVLIGSSIGGYTAAEPFIRNYYEHVRMSPFTIPISMNIAPGSNISIKYGFQGPLVNMDGSLLYSGAFHWECF
jgi:3-oxoacyl-(acyl-carrier-protein) synthase